MAQQQEISEQSLATVVLLVDDQAFIAEAVRRAIAVDPSINFRYCAEPEDALRYAAETRPTVILQDLVMPGIDGLTLVRRYRETPATCDIPIIVLSTNDDPQTKSAAFAAGANDYLVKLPDSIELIARISYHSRSYSNLLQRDEAYRALRHSQQQLLETNLELQRLTNSDGLTGLSNRRYFDEYLRAEWRRAERDQTPLGLLMIDVDNFKAYNDYYGHVAGDEVLKRVAEALRSCTGRSTDLVARFGGEEFSLILPTTAITGVRMLAEKARAAVEALQLAHQQSASGVVTVSAGGSVMLPAADPTAMPVALVEAADLCLYRAKAAGRNGVVV
ncbi:MAG: diguanylate cyclase [Janthinobacterium lividum]